MNQNSFEDVTEFPDSEVKKRYDQLVGLDYEKSQLLKQSTLLLNPDLLIAWSNSFYKKEISILKQVQSRPPLFIFAGDVGTGKASLAESFGDAIARKEKMEISLFRLSLKTRGNGTVGDMTNMISSAFETVLAEGKKGKSQNKKQRRGIILVIDEADALAQSRESAQMHHEDRAGVNALIRGVDTISGEHLPVIVVMCTNRLSAIDPAIKRRAAFIFDFARPNEVQRRHIFERALEDCAFSEEQLSELVKQTGPLAERAYGYTYSDIMQRFLPSVVLHFFPDQPIDAIKTLALANQILPTPPFKDKNKD